MTDKKIYENEAPKQVLNIQRIYTKESSCTMENAPDVFKHQGGLKHSMEIKFDHTKLSEKNHYEVVLDIAITTSLSKDPADEKNVAKDLVENKVEKDITVSKVQVKQAGIFQLEGFDEKQIDQLLKVYCPEVLFPYARHVVSELTTMSSMPPVILLPMSFLSLYQETQKKSL